MSEHPNRPTRVSVVVPTYGRPEYLVEAVESVAAQTYPALELVVVDDHSPEPVEPFLAEASLAGIDWRCIRHEENRGANAARRTGIDATEGEVIAFLDDDDYWRPTLVERVVEAFDAGGPDVGVVTVGTTIVNADGEQIGRSTPEFSGPVTEDILAGTIDPGTYSQTSVRRSVLSAAGLPDERFPSWQDREWHIRLSQHCTYESVPEDLAVRRYTDHEQITDDFEAKRDVSYPLLIEKHRSLAASYGQRCQRRFVSHMTKSLGFAALRNGYYRESIRFLLRALRCDPTYRDAYLFLAIALGGPLTYRPARWFKRSLSGTVDIL